jgi:DNA polymerase V
MLLDLIPNHIQQLSLFTNNDHSRKIQLMKTIDHINHAIGQHALFYCAEGTKPNWHIKREYRSPRYTTRLDEIFTAYC